MNSFSKTLNQSGFMKVFAKNMSVFDECVTFSGKRKKGGNDNKK
jgi:hypothetical protein